MLTVLQERWVPLASGFVFVALAGALFAAWCRMRARRLECERERRGRAELEAYARLDLRVSSQGDLRSLPRRVCSVIAARSAFSRVAMLMYSEENRLCVAAREGMDAAAVEALDAWLGRSRPGKDGMEDWDGETSVRLGTRSMVVRLDPSSEWTNGRAILIPIQTNEHRLGALLVLADSILQIPRPRAEEAVIGLETLAVRLTYELEHLPSEMQAFHFQKDEETQANRNGEPYSLMMSTVAGRREEIRISIQKI